MPEFRFFVFLLGLCAILTCLSGQGRAATLTYASDSIVEFDLFHQWTLSGGFLWALPSEPVPAAWARLHVEIDETLDHSGLYRINNLGHAPAGYTLISDFTLSVETDRGRYEIGDLLYGDFELILETDDAGSSPRGTPASWHIAWEFGVFPSDSDHFRLEGASGADQVSWLWEYMEHPDDIWARAAFGGSDFTGGRLGITQGLGQNQLPPVPLPAPVLLLLSGLAGLAGLRRIRQVMA